MPGKDGYYKGSMVYIQYLIVAGMLLAAVFYLAFNMLPGFADNKENKMDAMDYSVAVSQDDQQLFGNIMIKTEDEVSLACAKVLINGESAGDLAEGSLLLRVHPGDLLSIDGSAYNRQLFFYLQGISSNIDASSLDVRIMTNGNVVEVGEIIFK